MTRKAIQPEKISQLQIDYLPLDQVEKWPRNPKSHDLGTLGDSMNRFGFVQPIVMDEGTKRLVAGHGRIETLARLKAQGAPPPDRVKVGVHGEWLVPVLRGVEFENEQEAEAYLVADNRLVELGGWDDRMLSEILTDMKGRVNSFTGTGYDQAQLERMLADMQGKINEQFGDEEPEGFADESQFKMHPIMIVQLRVKREDAVSAEFKEKLEEFVKQNRVLDYRLR